MLLDTCALLWLTQGREKFSAEVCKQIAEIHKLKVITADPVFARYGVPVHC